MEKVNVKELKPGDFIFKIEFNGDTVKLRYIGSVSFLQLTAYVFVDTYKPYEPLAMTEDDLKKYYKFEYYEDMVRAKVEFTKERYEIAVEELKRIEEFNDRVAENFGEKLKEEKYED